ncbi:HvfA family oxazolone/thioamide-modified RiPP metallophore [Luteimonas sp. A649]
MSKSHAKPVALAVAAALGGIALSGAAFSMAPLASGYMVAAQEAADPAVATKDAEGRCGMSRVDTDGDGRMSADEFSAAHPEKDPSYFATMDGNGDGFVDKDEHDAHHAEKKAASGDKDADKAAQEGKCGEGKCGGSGACGGAA